MPPRDYPSLEALVDLLARHTAEAIAQGVAPLAARLDEVEARGLEYRGQYERGQTYRRGAAVTYSGSLFIAMADTLSTDVPEASPAWRLACKRGRDGKDAK